MLIFLTGYMGCGKSTTGRSLSSLLNYTFIDTDKYIEDKVGMTIPEVFETKGESAFREMERDALSEIVKLENAIVSTGGGLPCFFNNQDVMNEHGICIYIQLNPNEILHRVTQSNTKRPLLDNKNEEEKLAFITENLIKRDPFYTKAKYIIDGRTISAYQVKNVLTCDKDFTNEI